MADTKKHEHGSRSNRNGGTTRDKSRYSQPPVSAINLGSSFGQAHDATMPVTIIPQKEFLIPSLGILGGIIVSTASLQHDI